MEISSNQTFPNQKPVSNLPLNAPPRHEVASDPKIPKTPFRGSFVTLLLYNYQ